MSNDDSAPHERPPHPHSTPWQNWPPTQLDLTTGPKPGSTPAPPGSRYHAQGRNGRATRRDWWGELLLVTGLIVVAVLGVYMVGLILADALHAGPAAPDSDRVFSSPLADMALQLAALGAAIPAVLVGVHRFGRRPVGTVSSVTGGLRWGWLLRCAMVALPVMAAQLGLLLVWTWDADSSPSPQQGFPGWPMLVLSLVVLWALIPFQAAAEEYVFRGWLVQLTGRVTRSQWPGIALASLLFALAHGFGEATGFALLFYSAMWWGWLVIRTGGLEAVIALHTANNALAMGLAAALGELADDGTAADAPWQALVLELVFTPLYCLTMARLADRRALNRQTP
ncbi:CPBP family intramembrane glutamic endopeptidase [Streptomyces sp. NPDC047071]|uniref:CPBP family intramembrane glutamic endopeptidase n=1 Tax=Streptomyces sp. NPDC047071 TaxID=3154808 RepID=UPI0034539A6E